MQSTKELYEDLKEEQRIRLQIVSEFEALQAAVERLEYENKQLRRIRNSQKSEMNRIYDALIFFETVRDNMDQDQRDKYDKLGDQILIRTKGGNHEK